VEVAHKVVSYSNTFYFLSSMQVIPQLSQNITILNNVIYDWKLHHVLNWYHITI